MDPSKSSTGNHRHKLAFPLAVLFAGLFLTAIATVSFHYFAKIRAQRRFDGAAAEAQEAIQTRLESYIALLRGGAALLSVKPETTLADWREFVSKLYLQEIYPGAQGIGLTLRMQPGETNRVITQLREQGLTNFTIRPTFPRPEYHAIVYLEPLDRRNFVALGYDMFTEETRRLAMERAWTNAQPAASGKVRLVQEIEGPEQAGFLIYLPVYEGGSAPPTIAERRKALRGFVYSPFRADDLFTGIFANKNPLRLGLEVFDGYPAAPEKRLHTTLAKSQTGNSSPRFQAQKQLEVAGRIWTLAFFSTPAFEANTAARLTVIVALLGILASGALFYFARKEASAREAAEQSAHELEQKVAERTSQLSEIVAELEGFSYSISHDLRAPLRAMQSFAQILTEECANNISPEARDYSRRISAAANRMDRLVQDVLNYSRIARNELPMTSVNTEKLLREILESYPTFQPPSAEIHMEGSFPHAHANHAMLTQCVSNILGNAVKFVAPGVTPRIRIWAETNAAKGTCKIFFQDNGVGIRKEHHESIFGIFSRLSNDYEGTGIGLAIVRKSVERMNGAVGLTSEFGKGSTFWLELQLEKTNATT